MPDPDAAAIRAKCIVVVLGQTPVTLTVTLVNAFLTAVVLWPAAGARHLVAWMALVAVVSAVRAGVWATYARNPHGAFPLRRWTAFVTVGSLASGLLWGFGAALLFPATAYYQLFLAFVVGGMCAGAATLYVSHFPTALAFVVPAAVPLAVRLAIEGSTAQVVSAVMILIFVAALLTSAYRASQAFVRSLQLQSELAGVNARLHQEMAGHQATEATLRQAQKMEAIGQLTGGIAHDFNNLLTAVIGNLDLIAHATADDERISDNEKIRRLAASAIAAAERGASLTGSLLAFARLQSLSSEIASVNALLHEFSGLLQHAAGDAITLELTPGPEVGMCQVDPAQFQSAILNLTINARDAMPEGGRLSIATRNVELAAADLTGNFEAEPGPFAAVSVSDNGSGMAADVLTRAFEPFFTTKPVGKGSGLGLSQVYGFARQAHGHVLLESRIGQGTTVTIFLPVEEGLLPAKPLNREAPALPDAGQPRILVVEDNADVLDAVAASLSEAGFDVVTASGGHAALQLLQIDQRIDILFSDVVMPNGMSGTELARKSRALRPELPILLTSGYAALARQGPEGDDHEFELINKPYRQGELVQRFRMLLR